MVYVVDTHSLVWFLSEDSKLSHKAKEVFEKVERGEETMIIPTIVLAELLYICEKKRVRDTFFDIIDRIAKGANYIPYDLNIEIILKCKNLTKITEMHDKIVTATAQLLKAVVITKDEEIKSSGYVETLW